MVIVTYEEANEGKFVAIPVKSGTHENFSHSFWMTLCKWNVRCFLSLEGSRSITEVIVWENIENIGNAVPGACLRIVDAIALAIALRMRMRAPLLCACKGHYTAHAHNS